MSSIKEEATTKSSPSKLKTKKKRHPGTRKLRISNARIEDAAWEAGKLRRDKLRRGLYLLKGGEDLQQNLESYISYIKAELLKRCDLALIGVKSASDMKEITGGFKGKLDKSIHYAPLKIRTICYQLAMSQLEKQHSTMIEMPFTYLLTDEQVELCRNQHDRGFSSHLAKRLQRKLREALDYSPAFYFTFENPPVPDEKKVTLHDRLPHIHGAMLFRPEDESAIRKCFYDSNNADVHSAFHAQEFRFHHTRRKECVDVLGEFDADIGWAIYQTKASVALEVHHHIKKITGFEDCEFATKEVHNAAKAIYADFRAIYNKPVPEPAKKSKKATSAIISAPTGGVLSEEDEAFFESLKATAKEEDATTTTAPVVTIPPPPTAIEIERMCAEIEAANHQSKETKCICNDIFKHGITADMIVAGIAAGTNLFTGITTGRGPVLRIACDLLIAEKYTKENLIEDFQKTGQKKRYADRRGSVVHNALKILKIISSA